MHLLPVITSDLFFDLIVWISLNKGMQSGREPQDVDTVYGSSSVVLRVCDIVTVKTTFTVLHLAQCS